MLNPFVKFQSLFNSNAPIQPVKTETVDDQPKQKAYQQGFVGGFGRSNFYQGFFGGETIVDGIPNKVDYDHLGSLDYYALRSLSRKLYVENPYAGMALGRIGTSVVNEGFRCEAEPSKLITGLNEDDTVEWSEKTEEYFKLWSRDKSVDWERVQDLSGLEKIAHMESLVEGDILVRIMVDEVTGLPSIKLISGRHVVTGTNSEELKAKNNTVEFGVELDKKRRHVAYHVVKRNEFGRPGTEIVRILAKGKTTGRIKTFLLYESPPPVGKVRGVPLLTRILQMTDQVGIYSTFELEAAKVNSSLAVVVRKTKDKAGTQPMRGVAKRSVSGTEENIDNVPKTYNQAGMTVHEMAYGEEITSFKTDRPNTNFKNFKDTILDDIAATLEIPPEILKLQFGNNFSASRQAVIEFKAYIRKARRYFTEQFNKPIYSQWLTGMVSKGFITADGYLPAVNSKDFFVLRGWQKSKWIGFVKQNVDMLKEAKTYEIYNKLGWITGEQAASELTESNFRTNVERLKPENEKLAESREPLLGDINTSKSVVDDNSSVNDIDND